MSRQEKVRALTLEMAGRMGIQKAAQAESTITALYPYAAYIIDSERQKARGNRIRRKSAKLQKQLTSEIAEIKAAVASLHPELMHPTASRLAPWTPPSSHNVPAANGSVIHEDT